MKILLVQDYLRSGGTERQTLLLANAFAAAANDTTLLTFRPHGLLRESISAAVNCRTLQAFDTGLDWFAPGLIRSVIATAPDIVLCMGRMANCYAGTIQKRVPASAVIATMRTGKRLPWLFRRSLRSVRLVVANSHDSRDALVSDYSIAPEKISVIHNSLVFPPESSFVRNDTLRREQRAESTTTVLLCVAMFRPEKNQRELIEIVSTFPTDFDWQLWLAGDGAARSACEQLAAEKKLGARVKFFGLLRDPSPLYAAADIAVHASASESLSNFLIEAQAHGIPAVVYAAQGIAETFQPDRTGWVIARGDRAAFRSAIERLASETLEQRERRSAEARAYARTTFDATRQVAAYLELFQKLIAATDR